MTEQTPLFITTTIKVSKLVTGIPVLAALLIKHNVGTESSYVHVPKEELCPKNLKEKGNPDLPSVFLNYYWPPKVAQFVFKYSDSRAFLTWQP